MSSRFNWPAVVMCFVAAIGCVSSESAEGNRREAIATNAVPEAIGPFSQAIRAGRMVFVSGQIALDRTGRKDLSTLDAGAQARLAMDNLVEVLAAAGLSSDDLVATTLYLVDIKDYEMVNQAYGSYFRGPPPARATVQVAALVRGAKIEISGIAFDSKPRKQCSDQARN